MNHNNTCKKKNQSSYKNEIWFLIFILYSKMATILKCNVGSSQGLQIPKGEWLKSMALYLLLVA